MLAAVLLAGAVHAAAGQAARPPLLSVVTDSVAARWNIDREDVFIETSPTFASASAAAALDGASGVLLYEAPGGYFTVVLRTATPIPKYTSGRFRAGSRMTVSVALVPVARGDTLSQDKAHLENRMVWGKPQPPVAAVPSGIMRRPVKAGEVIDPAFVAALFAVQAGDTLLVTMKEPALTIHLHAIALSGGALGATIPVRVSPARVARAEVTGRSTAMLKP